LEKLAGNKHSLLLQKYINYSCKKFNNIGLRELKEILWKILARMDSELLEFSTQSDPLFTWPEWNKLAEEKTAIQELLSKLNFDSVQKELQKEFGCSKNEILVSSILHNFFPSSLISQSGNPY
jgi:hypothetical protein